MFITQKNIMLESFHLGEDTLALVAVIPWILLCIAGGITGEVHF